MKKRTLKTQVVIETIKYNSERILFVYSQFEDGTYFYGGYNCKTVVLNGTYSNVEARRPIEEMAREFVDILNKANNKDELRARIIRVSNY